MHQQHSECRVSSMCRLLHVSRSGYYEWRSRPRRTPAEADQQWQDKVTRYLAQGRGTYGTRRIKYL
jgi:putative transposase